MSDAEDAIRMVIEESFKNMPPAKATVHRPSGTAWGVMSHQFQGVHPPLPHGYHRLKAMGMNRHWIVSFKVRVDHSNTIGTLKDHCQDFEAEVDMDCGRTHVLFTVRRVAHTAAAAMVEANDWVYELLFREGGEEQMSDCRVTSLSVEALDEFRERIEMKKNLISLQEEALTYHKSDPMYGGFPSNWDTSGFDVTDA